MPYYINGAVVSIGYRCSNCGATGEYQTEGEEFVDNTFGIYGVDCPECGQELTKDEDLENEDE